MAYKHHIGITSQAYFCASPLRLDTQNRCQMGCTYCFAKARGGHRSESGIRFADHDALKRRFTRVRAGDLHSVVDEFLARRIPIQLGGMSDPFAVGSVRLGVTRSILEVLTEYDYPTIISTKGRQKDILAELERLKRGNFYVRISMAASKFPKAVVEPGTPAEEETFETIQALSEAGLNVCLRLQPLFPGSEEDALRKMVRGKRAGIVAVSLEYLKVPRERSSSQYKALDALYGGSLDRCFASLDARISGREISVGASYKKHHLSLLKKEANAQGIRVGIAENELLHYGDLAGCCNGGSQFLTRSSNFDYTIPAALKRIPSGGLIRLEQFESAWCPTGNIGAHFNSDSRLGLRGAAAHWRAYFERQWHEPNAHFNPTFFDGVRFEGLRDHRGSPIFTFTPAAEFSG